MWYASKVSACRRGLNSHETAMSRLASNARGLAEDSRNVVSASAQQNQDMRPLCLIVVVPSERASRLQSVRQAAATIATVHRSSGPGGLNTGLLKGTCAEVRPWQSASQTPNPYACGSSGAA